MRGEHRAAGVCKGIETGSSPHARGTLGSGSTQQYPLRFIPACAGNTTGVHSRMTPIAGSSPHARGTPSGARFAACSGRFIPACAGNTQNYDLEQGNTSGSSPHARGTPLGLLFCQSMNSVHPRMRGEHRVVVLCTHDDSGSSPHARGTLLRHLPSRPDSRFIPACAGNTSLISDKIWVIAVHPRMRGEHHDQDFDQREAGGSSPHARGTLGLGLLVPALARCIPACAGNTSRG